MAAKKGTTVYQGVNYKRVYNYSYYMKKYPAVKKLVGGDDKKAIRYFVTKGMMKQHQAISTFNVKSYRYGNPALRKKYRLNYRKYYLHYMKTGYKTAKGKATRTGIKKMKDPVTVYKGKDYKSVYSYAYYRAHNADVRKKYKDDDYAILKHYVTKGRKEGRAGSAKEAARLAKEAASSAKNVTKNSFEITSARISGANVVVTAVTTEKDGLSVSLFGVPSYVSSLKDASPAASATVKGTSVTLTAPLRKDSADSLLMCKLLLGVKDGSSYKVASNPWYIENPEACAPVRTAFPKARRGTKKGLKMLIAGDLYVNKAAELNLSHVIADFPIEQFLRGSGLKYTYEGKTYEFSASILSYQAYLKKLRDNGIVVTGVFYLSDPGLTDYMLPSAAKADKSKSAIFGLNTVNANRKRLEAMFACVAEYFTSGGALVGNWIFGNESNQFRTYCFSGSVTYSRFIKDYCDSFRLFNTAVKSRYANARTYLSFDHNWNLSFDLGYSYNAKTVLASIAAQLKKEGNIHFDVALHPYPSPEQDPRVWNRSSLVSDSALTQQYVPLNMAYVASYIKKTYGSNVHIILPETGINSLYNGKDMQAEQAAGIAYAYYLTEFNPDIDMIGIHREKDDPGENAAGFRLGIYGSSFDAPKKAVQVFKYMDTGSWKRYTADALKTVGISSWKQAIPGFAESRFTGK